MLTADWDPCYGARLCTDLSAVGFADIEARYDARTVPGGSLLPRLLSPTIERLLERIVLLGGEPREIDQAQRLLEVPANTISSPTTWIVHGRRPDCRQRSEPRDSARSARGTDIPEQREPRRACLELRLACQSGCRADSGDRPACRQSRDTARRRPSSRCVDERGVLLWHELGCASDADGAARRRLTLASVVPAGKRTALVLSSGSEHLADWPRGFRSGRAGELDRAVGRLLLVTVAEVRLKDAALRPHRLREVFDSYMRMPSETTASVSPQRTTSGSTDARSLTSKADCPKSSIPLARRRLRGVPALLAEQKNRY
jgi:hypothetical protein